MSDRAEQGPLGSAEAYIRRAIDIVTSARTLPLSSDARVNRDELLELLEEAVQRLPEELRAARWMLKERDDFVLRTKREAEEIVEAARLQAARLVDRTEVVRQADVRARQLVDQASDEAQRMRRDTEDFIDQRLASFEVVLDKVMRTVIAGRERLQIAPLPEADEESAET